MGKLTSFIKEMAKPGPADGPSVILALNDAIGQAEEIRRVILHSSLPEKDKREIAKETLCLIDDIRKLQTTKLMETERLCQ